MEKIARLFSVLMTLEREFGLSALNPGERSVFDFIVQSNAAGRAPTSEEIVAINLGSRASVYRWLSALKEAGLIEAEYRDGQSCYSLNPKLDGFDHAFERAVSSVKA